MVGQIDGHNIDCTSIVLCSKKSPRLNINHCPKLHTNSSNLSDDADTELTDLIGVSRKIIEQAASSNVPHFDSGVRTATSQQTTVGRPRHLVHTLDVAQQRPHKPTPVSATSMTTSSSASTDGLQRQERV